MTSLIAKFVARKIFAETPLGKKSQGGAVPADDPYFEYVPATRLGRKTTKKRRRALPPGLTPQEEQVLNKVKRRAYRLDLSLFSLCGLRFGWSSVIGLVPFIGDFADMLLALIVYRTACTVEPPISAGTKMRMQINIVIDFILGLVPFVGDLADAAYKCNTKNAILFEQELRERGAKRLKQSGQPAASDPSAAHEFDHYADEVIDGTEHGLVPPRYDNKKTNMRPQNDLESGTANTTGKIRTQQPQPQSQQPLAPRT